MSADECGKSAIRQGEPPATPSRIDLEIARQTRFDRVLASVSGILNAAVALILIAAHFYDGFIPLVFAAFTIGLAAQVIAAIGVFVATRFWAFGLLGIVFSVLLLIASVVEQYGPRHSTPRPGSGHRHSIWDRDHVH
jgi:hypothetical protein